MVINFKQSHDETFMHIVLHKKGQTRACHIICEAQMHNGYYGKELVNIIHQLSIKTQKMWRTISLPAVRTQKVPGP